MSNPFIVTAPRTATERPKHAKGAYDALITQVQPPVRDNDGATRAPVGFNLIPAAGGDAISHTERIDTPLPATDDEGNIVTNAEQFPEGTIPNRLKEALFSDEEADVFGVAKGSRYFVPKGCFNTPSLFRACGIPEEKGGGFDFSKLEGCSLRVDIDHTPPSKTTGEEYMQFRYRAAQGGTVTPVTRPPVADPSSPKPRGPKPRSRKR